MSTSSGSLQQGPSSPSPSTAASSNPFVRSHHQDPTAPVADSESPYPHQQAPATTDSKDDSHYQRIPSSSSLSRDEGTISVAIKCPSLDTDSANVNVKLTDTVLDLKQTIERTWSGAPRANGMRCIKSGRMLQDNEVFSQLIQGVSSFLFHLVVGFRVRDSCTDVPLIFLSLLRLDSHQLEAGEPLSLHLVIRPDAWSDPQNRPTPSRRSSYLRQQQQQSLLRAALATQLPTEDDAAPRHQAPPEFDTYFSEASTSQIRTEEAPSRSAEAGEMLNTPGHGATDAYAVLEETLRITAPDNWPMLIEALTAACEEYVLMYESVYNEAYAAQKSAGSSHTPPSPRHVQSALLTNVETTLLGWNPVQLPTQDSASSSSDTNEPQYLYQQTTHRGLPYLLRLTTSPLDVQRSETLHTLLHRISTLRSMIDKLENIIMLGRIFSSSSTSSPSTTPLQPPQAGTLEQGGLVASTYRLTQTLRSGLRSTTFADVTAVLIPMFFLGFKVGILLSVMLRGADRFKKYFVLGMASCYIAFESYRIVQRRMRVRQRRPDTPVAPAAPTPAPAASAGANVPAAPSVEETAERQATESPHLPLPPPQAPPRFSARTTSFSLDWWIDHMAFIGLNAEDEELGLLPSSPGSAGNVFTKLLSSTFILPLLLFVVTMVPAVELRRKRAIEERERVIRKWIRLEQERRERVAELEQKEQGGSEEVRVGREDEELQQKRAEYADRVLRQRRRTEAEDVDDEDRLQAIAGEDDDDAGGMMEDMNIF